MTFIEELQDYIFSPGLVSYRKLAPQEKDPKTANEDPSGNGIRDLCMALVVAFDNKELTTEFYDKFLVAINKCAITPGLYKRSPRKPDQNSIDDYIWLALASPSHARDIFLYGEKHPGKIFGIPLVKYCYNTEKPGQFSFKAWLGRQPQLKAHFWACSGWPVPESFAKQWANNLYASLRSNPTDGDAWLHSWALHRRPPSFDFCRKAAMDWRSFVISRYGVKWAQGIAARTLEPGHPIGKKFIF